MGKQCFLLTALIALVAIVPLYAQETAAEDLSAVPEDEAAPLYGEASGDDYAVPEDEAPPPGETIAVHPMWGATDEEQYIAPFLQSIVISLLPGFPVPGTFNPWNVYIIDLENDLPADVPEGGFPPYICPSPSLTNGAEYAITGEVNIDQDNYGFYLRMYLWRMEDNRLLVSDQMWAYDMESFEQGARGFLRYLLSQIPVETEPAEENLYVYPVPRPEDEEGEEISRPPPPYEEEPQKWLWLGLSLGGGSSTWFHASAATDNLPAGNHYASLLFNANVAFRVTAHLLRFLDVQTEANVAVDFARYSEFLHSGGDDIVFRWYMTVPLLVKLNLTAGRVRAGVFAGPYVYIPLALQSKAAVDSRFEYEPDFPGFTFGTTIGWKLGPGNIFLDARFNYDGRWDDIWDIVYLRNTIKVNIGYEMGFFKK